MSKYMAFEEIKIGDTLGPMVIPSDEESIKYYCDEHKIDNPLYLKDSPFGGPVLPPLWWTTLVGLRLVRSKLGLTSMVPSKVAQENLNPAKVGKRLTATGKVIDKYIKRGLKYVVVESLIVDEDGVEIRRSVDHSLLSLERRPTD
jgi:acyl dehydratase